MHDAEGLPSFAGLQQRGRLTRAMDIGRAAVQWPATFYAFDLLLFGDHDLRGLPLLDRKRLLAEVLPTVGPIRVSEHIEREGEAMFEHLKALKLEGMVAKRAGSVYIGRRSSDWVKASARSNDDFAVVGYTKPKGHRTGFGALLLAQRGEEGWVYAGRVGGGFGEQDLVAVSERLAAATPGEAPRDPDEEVRPEWIVPEFVVEVTFKRRSQKGRLRQPTFICVREDKDPEDCWLPGEEKPLPEKPRKTVTQEPSVTVTNPEKVFWPDEALTKADLVAYYRSVAKWLLPYLKDRPLVLTRYPDGIDGQVFLPKGCARVRSRVDKTRNAVERRLGTRDTLFRHRRRRRPGIRGKHGGYPAAHLVQPFGLAAAPRLVHPRPRS